MTRNICVTAADGQTGYLIAELLLSRPFSGKVDSVVALTLNPESPKAKGLAHLGAKIVPHVPGHPRALAGTLKESQCDTLCLVPPAHEDKFEIAKELVVAAKEVNVQNTLLISSAACEYADPTTQPRLREFIDLECLFMESKGDMNTSVGHSPCIIRAGFYAENLLLYSPQAQSDGLLPLPIGKNHKLAPVALGDVANVAAHVLTGKGEKGFSDKHRGQLMVITGPKLCDGDELATAASQTLGVDLKYDEISPSEAKRVLKAQSESDESEQEYLLEYYALAREGKTNYISTTAFHDVTGAHPTEPEQFFKLYKDEFKPSKKAKHNHN